MSSFNHYRGKHAASSSWAVSSTASSSYRPKHAKKDRRALRIRLLLLCLVLFLLLIPFLIPLWPQTETVHLSAEDLPKDIGKLRLVFVTDIHSGFFFSDSRVNALINRINNLKPDIVLFGGDYATDTLSAIRFFKKIPDIHARYTSLGVLGETDRKGTDSDLLLLTDAMREAGVTPLVNDMLTLRIKNSSIDVIGLDYETMGTSTIPNLVSKVSNDHFVILMAHNPTVIPEAQSASDKSGHLGWFDLGLFGHTHGGQIAGLSGVLDIAPEVDSKYLGGWIQENRIDMLISNGVGTSVIPARLFCPPQIHCIEVETR